MKNYLTIIIALSVFMLCAAVSCKTKQVPEQLPKSTPLQQREVLGSILAEGIEAKNVILLIGDGMGIGQITAGTYANGNKTNLEKFKIVGLHKPHAGNNLVTDSAAAATSFACGVKTYNNAIGVDMDTMPVQTILEEAEKKGLRTGLVATSTIVHATPASFIAHNKSRRNYEEIAEDFLRTEVDFFAGGGKKFFDRREKDDRDLTQELVSKGYVVENHLKDFAQARMSMETADKFAYFTADNDPLSVYQGRDYLESVSMAGINFLNQKAADDGFFMMIESSQIDWGGHANNSEWIIEEFKEFDRLIGKVLSWAEADGETLVVVTADHETGGYTIQPGSRMDSLNTAFTTTKHSGDFIPVFASGPGSERFSGIYENTEIYHKMRAAYGWGKK